MAVCPWCVQEFTPSGRGRPPRFCSDVCRKAQHQRERTLKRQFERYSELAATDRGPNRYYFAEKASEVADLLASVQLAART